MSEDEKQPTTTKKKKQKKKTAAHITIHFSKLFAIDFNLQLNVLEGISVEKKNGAKNGMRQENYGFRWG